jgi:hypothetical protein
MYTAIHDNIMSPHVKINTSGSFANFCHFSRAKIYSPFSPWQWLPFPHGSGEIIFEE